MIAAVIILTLISLLVATDPEPASESVPPLPEPPLRPERVKTAPEPAEPDRLAA